MTNVASKISKGGKCHQPKVNTGKKSPDVASKLCHGRKKKKGY